MDKNLLKALAQNPDLIPGIYNFCDAWCERCPFQAKCLNYLMMEMGVSGLEEKDMEKGNSWDEMEEVFQVSFELLKEAAQNLGMELPDGNADFDVPAEQMKDDQVFNSQLMRQADKYVELVNDWFAKHEKMLIWQGKTLQDLLAYVDDLPPSWENRRIKEMYEVIQWYQYLIPSKLFRALRGNLREENDPNQYQREYSRGAAKVALLAMDQSIDSWQGFLEFFPQLEDSILPILLLLAGMRTLTEAALPRAREFQRPGFDRPV